MNRVKIMGRIRTIGIQAAHRTRAKLFHYMMLKIWKIWEAIWVLTRLNKVYKPIFLKVKQCSIIRKFLDLFDLFLKWTFHCYMPLNNIETDEAVAQLDLEKSNK